MATVPLKSSHDRMSLIKTAVKDLDSDVEIVSSEGDILLANSFLMSKASPFLQSLLLPLLPTDNQTSVRIHLPDISKRSLSHLLNILKQGFTTGLGAGNSLREEVQEAARALRFAELPVLSMSSNKEYVEEADDEYDKKIKSERYCILCQMFGHTFSEACVVNARCHSCGVKGHVRRDCNRQNPDIKGEVKREYWYLKQEKSELSIKGEMKRENFDCKEEKYDVKDIKLDVEKEKIYYEEEYIELESPKEEEKEIDKEADKCENNNTIDTNDFEAAHLPLAHQEPQQPSNSYSPRENKAVPAVTKRKLPERKRKVSHGSYLENSVDDGGKVQKRKKKRIKLYDEGDDDKEYRCAKCDYKSRYKQAVTSHQKAVHDKVKYPCPECEYKATRISYLKDHIKTVHEGVRYQCPECDYEAARQDSLNFHIQSIHEGNKFSCSECEFEATHQRSLSRHIKSIHQEVKYPCSECVYKATDKGNLNKHIKVIHEGFRFQCSECDYKATQKRLLDNHVRRKHESDSDEMSPKSASNRNKAKKSPAMTPDFSLQPGAPTIDDPYSGSSHSSHGRKSQPKRKAKENKKIPAENDLNDSIIVNDSDDTESDEDYDPDLE